MLPATKQADSPQSPPVGNTAATASALPALDASKLTVVLTDAPLPIPTTSQSSTKTHTDHLLTVSWTSTLGWSAAKIAPYKALHLPPTASVLHYATACFEGTRLYRGYDGKLRVFRLIENCRRIGESSTRISMPAPDPEELCKLIKELCRIEGRRWLPSDTSKGENLYIRPTIIGVDADLECHVPNEVLLFVVITYWPLTANPFLAGLKLWASPDNSERAWPGGSGNKKISSNYAPALQIHSEAQRRGFDQVLWLHGQERIVTEAGGTNFFAIWRTSTGTIELITAPLDIGLILPGITRRSILELARARFNTSSVWELDGEKVTATEVSVVEREFTMFDLVEASNEGRLLATFATGTAYFVRPVTEISFQGKSFNIPPDAMPHAALLRKWLSDIIYGIEESEWTDLIHN
ncbi:aminotransferase [Pyrenochaeta sp. MPI-SDFR-AT-0127]|nr:aminotransferase [Pyrenochaeta sp. MPI-SDFR-AT-0127]